MIWYDMIWYDVCLYLFDNSHVYGCVWQRALNEYDDDYEITTFQQQSWVVGEMKACKTKLQRKKVAECYVEEMT